MSSREFSPLRSRYSFGVAGLLGEECRVFYQPISGYSSIGRISDLMSAKLRSAAPDEYKFRLSILNAIFSIPKSVPSQQSVSIEIGIDREKIAIGVSWVLPKGSKVEIAKLKDRLVTQAPADDFEKMLFLATKDSHSFVIRYQQKYRRLELVCLLPFEWDTEAVFDAVEIPDEAEATPKAFSYTELGDLDTKKLLAPEGKASISDPDLQELVVGRDIQEAGSRQEVIDSSSEEKKAKAEISGKIQREFVSKIEGATQEEEVIHRISGGFLSKVTRGIGGFLSKIFGFGKKSELPELSPLVPVESQPQAPSPQEVPFEPVAPTEPPVEQSAADVAGVTITDQTQGEPTDALPTDPTIVDLTSNQQILEQVREMAELDLTKTEEIMKEIREDISSPDTKKLFDESMKELLAERAKMKEFSKSMNNMIKQMDLEFQGRETALKEQVRAKDELLRQRQLLISRSKEQLTSAAIEIERMKSLVKNRGDSAMLKDKVMQLNNELNVAREQNVRMLQKIDEFKTRLNVERNNAMSMTMGASNAEVHNLKQRAERAAKEVEDIKRQNHKLLERLDQEKRKTSGNSGQLDQMRKMLENASKMVMNHKRDNDRLHFLVNQSKQVEANAKAELKKAQAELMRLKTGVADPTKKKAA
ncbi:MAG: hypothetical protein JNL01_11210 [Bdellovibrionales bacterium]|nr:hypothetical protein [Bdellovibrionales bacterium]